MTIKELKENPELVNLMTEDLDEFSEDTEVVFEAWAIGYDKEGNICLVVIDGRHQGQGDGASIYETALICSFLGLTDAINLDGGGSSAIWSSETGVLNHPSDNKVFDHEGERVVPNIIGVF